MSAIVATVLRARKQNHRPGLVLATRTEFTVSIQERSTVAINDHGVVVGNGNHDAFKWSPETGVVWLGSLGGNECQAADINNQGQIVGWSDSDGRYSQVAFLWQDGQMFDLNQITDGAGGKNWLQRAYGINDAGHIVGEVRLTKPVSENHAFLLVPNANVP